MALSGVYPATLVQAVYEQTYTAIDGTVPFPGFKPGDVSIDNCGGKWMFVKAGSAIAQYDLVYVTGAAIPIAASATSTLLTTTASYFIGIAQVAIASGSYGWVWNGPGGGIGRGIKVNVSGSTVLNVKIYGNASTAGAVDDAVVAPLIQNLQLTATTASGAGEVYAAGYLTINAQD